MTVEYIVLGIVVLLVAAGQIYFRHFADVDEAGGGGRRQIPTRAGKAGGKIWQGWTAALGFVGVAFGFALIVLGALGL